MVFVSRGEAMSKVLRDTVMETNEKLDSKHSGSAAGATGREDGIKVKDEKAAMEIENSKALKVSVSVFEC